MRGLGMFLGLGVYNSKSFPLPTSIDATNLTLWQDPRVDVAADHSGLGNNFTNGGGALAADINGKASVQFTAGSLTLQTGPIWSSLVTASAATIAFIGMDRGSAADSGHWYTNPPIIGDEPDNSSGFLGIGISAGLLRTGGTFVTGGTIEGPNRVISANVPFYGVFIFAGNNMYLSFNGSVLSAPVATSGVISQLTHATRQGQSNITGGSYGTFSRGHLAVWKADETANLAQINAFLKGAGGF